MESNGLPAREGQTKMQEYQRVDATHMRHLSQDSMDKNRSIEETQTSYKGYFPEELPPRERPPPAVGGKWRQRMSGLRAGIWTFNLSSYSIVHTENRAARLRHIAMITILVLRTAMSALSILAAVVKGSVAGIVVYSILAALSMWFTATCLAIIGDAEGEKPLWRFRVKRWHFDAFFVFCIIVHSLLIVLFFFNLPGWGLEITNIGMWLAILYVAWIAGWQPELPTRARTWVS